ncbi:MAG: hypothetical protein Q7U04_02020 [Bacteriovorax sp.]|nr:hypothetical protein [Bacteriovorax sp.]
MMKTNKFTNIFTTSSVAFLVMSAVLTSCVPKVTEKKAVCGTNQTFNTVSRTCISTSEIRTRPVGTKSSDTLSQEVAKTITLSYTDNNQNSALSCSVSSLSSNIEAVSPQVLNGGIFNQASTVAASATNLASNLTGASGVSAMLEVTAMQNALTSAQLTFSYTNVITQLGLFKTAVDNINALAVPLIGSLPTALFYYNLTQSNILVYTPLKTFVDNRCDCTGGVCTTSIAPRIVKSGSAGFTYTVSDIDGSSDPKVVNLTIAATAKTTNYLKPAVDSAFQTLTQNSVHAAIPYSISLPVGGDYFGTSGTTGFNYYFNGTITGGYGITANGKVSNCMDLIGSPGLTTTTCTYTPTNGDGYDIITPVKAAVTIDDLVFTAKSEGAYANNYSIQYFDLGADNTGIDSFITFQETFGLVSQIYTDTFLRVVGNNIQVFLVKNSTTSTDIKNLINSDSKAKTLVTVSKIGGAVNYPDPAVLTPAAITFGSGTLGVDAFDTIPVKVSNGFATSNNISTVMLKMSHTDHAPLVPIEYNADYMPLTLTSAATTAEAEATAVPQVITLPYFDVDNTPIVKAVTCAVDYITPPNIGLTDSAMTTCTCVAGVCSVSVVPTAFFNGTAKFSYTVTTIDQFSVATKISGSQTVNMSIWEVNNAPALSISSATATAAGVPTVYPGPIPNPLQIQENSTAAPSSAFVCFTANAGGGTDEAGQILTIVPTQTAPTSSVNLVMNFGTILLPAATGNTCASGQYMLPFTTTQNQSGTTNLTITITDNGTTHSVLSPQSTNIVIPILVNSVDDPPFFIQTITSVQTNEGGAVVAGPFIVDEDEGSSPDEDTQAIKIANIVSDNTGVLPLSAISVFYDSNNNGVADTGETRTFGSSSTIVPGVGVPSLDSASPTVDDVKSHSFYLKLSPIAGVSGNSNITITINDGNAAASHFISKQFSLIINPVAALHGGWANISAIGIKTDKNGAPAAVSDVVCNYNKAADLNKCDTTGTDCTGTTPPNSVVTPTAVNVLYWDSSNKRCYRSQSTDKFSWIDIRTSCPITRVTGAQNYIYDPTLLPAQVIPAKTATGQYYFDTSTNTCFYTTQTSPGVYAWNSPYIPAKVTLSWNPYTIVGSGADSSVQIEGWNVYRREKGYDYDFKNGFLKLNIADTKTINDSTTRTYTDNTAIAGKVYYYLVRPIDNKHHLPTYTPEIFSEVRVLAPVENYAFVHRWMANQEMCNSMHMTLASTKKVDPTHNYRCPYSGPGEGTGSNVGYYDIEKDMLVDISESGCPYTASPKCTSDGCVGIGDPNSLVSLGIVTGMVANNIYYDRSAGSCYIYNGATWLNYNSAGAGLITAASTKVSSALNAPLANLSQSQATLVCNNRSVVSATAGLTGIVAPATTASLPSKKEYMAYSATPIGMSDSTITDLEQGFSLNLQSRCNSSNANGVESAYTDSNIPSTSYIYSLPGTASSGIRSLYTGSVPWVNNFSTESCSSRYGVQDVYGNVAEWVKDKMTCPSNYVCTTVAGTTMGDYDFDTVGSTGKKYAFDFLTGPYNDVNGDSATTGADAFLLNWDFKNEYFAAGKFSYPIGMPINVDIATASSGVLAASAALSSLLDIGPTSGLTEAQLHEDGIIANGAAVNNSGTNPTQIGSFAQGGSYLSGNRSGRYSSELVPDATVRPDIGFRCYIPVVKDNFPVDTGRHNYSY